MLSRPNLFILGGAVIAAVVGGWLQYLNRPVSVPAEVDTAGVDVAHAGDFRPDLVLQDLDGKEHHLAAFRGKRVLLNFWASWCGPCLAEMPALDSAGQKFSDQGATVLGIAMDDPVRVRAYLRDHPVHYPIVIGQWNSPSTSLRLGDTDNVLPYSVLLDEKGRILAVQRGALDAAKLARWLSPATAL